MIFGHSLIREMLANATASNRLHHALLFWGAPGIGKSTLALHLVRLLNCLSSEEHRPCGKCRNCRRIAFPFPAHPDVRVLRDITVPLYLPREEIFQRFIDENPIVGQKTNVSIEQEYLEGIELLVKSGSVIRHHCCNDADPPVDILVFDKDKDISPAMIEKHSADPIKSWLFHKLYAYQQSVCYNRYIKIDMIREIQKMLHLHSFEGRIKAVVIDDADRMLVPAQNSLLKILEEPPEASILILITKNPKGLLSTIRSRCQILPFYRLSSTDLEEGLVNRFGFNRNTAEFIAGKAQGSFAEALETDWAKQTDERTHYDKLFEAGQLGGVDWVMRLSNQVTGNTTSETTEGLSQLYRWLHDRVCSHPNSDRLDGSLPRNRPFTVEIALKIMDGITDILNRSNYNLDTRLQFESMLVKILKETA